MNEESKNIGKPSKFGTSNKPLFLGLIFILLARFPFWGEIMCSFGGDDHNVACGLVFVGLVSVVLFFVGAAMFTVGLIRVIGKTYTYIRYKND